MERKITLSLVLALSVVIVSLMSSDSTAKALVFPGAAAAPKQRCTFTPVEGTTSWVTAQPENNPLGVLAMWDAIVHCEQPSSFEGQTIGIEQRLAVRIDDGRAMGPTQILVRGNTDWAFHGRVRGPVTCDAGVCTLNLETRANGPGGSQLHGSGVIEVNTATDEIVFFAGPIVAIIHPFSDF